MAAKYKRGKGIDMATDGYLSKDGVIIAADGYLSVEVVVVDPTPQPRPGGSSGGGFIPGASGTYQEFMVTKGKTAKQKEEEELLLLMRIFTKVCPNT